MSLSATVRGSKNGNRESRGIFELTEGEKNPPAVIPESSNEPLHVVWRRLKLKISSLAQDRGRRKKLADKIAELALANKYTGVPCWYTCGQLTT